MDNPENKKLNANYHTHTELCKHATGMPREYIVKAWEAGCSALGFSDHCPYPDEIKEKFWASTRMSENQVTLYFEEIKKAEADARKAGFTFPVYTGFECEWDKTIYSWYKDDLLGGFSVDYLILGAHWITEPDGSHLYIAEVTDDVNLLHQYIDQTIEGMASGIFKFIAHPDMFMSGWKEWDKEAEMCSKALIDAAIDLDLPLEVNGFGIIKPMNETSRGLRFQYPYREFWEMVAEREAKVICNSDAHKPELVIENARHAREFAIEIGIKPENITEEIFK